MTKETSNLKDIEIRISPSSGGDGVGDGSGSGPDNMQGVPNMPGMMSVEDGTDNKTITGYAALFNTRSELLFDSTGAYFETIAPNAFIWTDVRALFNHDESLILARTSANTLVLEQDGRGLKYSFIVPDTTYGRDLAENIRLRNISQSSFGFITHRDDWHTEADGTRVRTIIRAELLDVSPVTYPAYVSTSVALRSFNTWQRQIKELETKIEELQAQLSGKDSTLTEKEALIAELTKQQDSNKAKDIQGLHKAMQDLIDVKKKMLGL